MSMLDVTLNDRLGSPDQVVSVLQTCTVAYSKGEELHV